MLMPLAQVYYFIIYLLRSVIFAFGYTKAGCLLEAMTALNVCLLYYQLEKGALGGVMGRFLLVLLNIRELRGVSLYGSEVLQRRPSEASYRL